MNPYARGAKGSYGRLIIELTGCQPDEAGGVEQIMRDTFHTLDNLDRARFKKEAKLALKILHAMWAEDELRLALNVLDERTGS